MQLRQHNDLPAFAFHHRLERTQQFVTREPPAKPVLPYPTAERERDGRPNAVAGQHNEKAPPESEEESTADTEYPSGQKQHVADCEQERITNSTPLSPIHDALLRRRHHFNDVEEVRQKQKSGNDRGNRS